VTQYYDDTWVEIEMYHLILLFNCVIIKATMYIPFGLEQQ